MAEFNGVIKDVDGKPVVPGDKIAAAFRIGNVAVLRIGNVLGYGERGNKLTLRVQWKTQSASHAAGGSKPIDIVGNIEADLTRFIRI